MSASSDIKKESKVKDIAPDTLEVSVETLPQEAISALKSGGYTGIIFHPEVAEKTVIEIIQHMPTHCILFLNSDLNIPVMRKALSSMPSPNRFVSINTDDEDTAHALENHIPERNFMMLPKLIPGGVIFKKVQNQWLMTDTDTFLADQYRSMEVRLGNVAKPEPAQKNVDAPSPLDCKLDREMKAALKSLNASPLDKSLIDTLDKFKKVAQSLNKPEFSKQYKAAVADLKWLGNIFLDFENPDRWVAIMDEINSLCRPYKIDDSLSLKEKLLKIADKKYAEYKLVGGAQPTDFFKERGKLAAPNQSIRHKAEEMAASDDSTETLEYS